MAQAPAVDPGAEVDAAQTDRDGRPDSATRSWVERAFHADEVAGLKIATFAQLVALAIIAMWLFAWVEQPPRIAFLLTNIAVFAVLAVANYRFARGHDRPAWTRYAIVAGYFTLLAFSMVGYDLIWGDSEFPPQMMLRNGTFVYFFMFLALISLSFRPQLVLFAGLVGALAWSVGVYLIARLPGTKTPIDHTAGLPIETILANHLDPGFVDTAVWTQDVIVLLLVAGVLAAGGWRARRLVFRQALAARERANLARYFSPRIVDRLAHADQPLGAVRAQPVAILFADIVGFTRIAEHQPPAEVIAMLRGLHARLETVVFNHSGTLDKYLGDGVMATFGTPETSPADAANALACGRAMLQAVDRWNQERAARGQPPLLLSVGLHYGEVVLGDIGSERRLEFAVIGDPVNVAARLEVLTRELGTRLVVSNDLLQAASGAAETVFAGLRRVEPRQLRGRETPIGLWVLDPAA